MISTHPIRSIARLATRTIVRSRACAWLSAATVGLTLGLPFALRGDGSAVGQMRMVITYPLASLFAVLLLGTLWISAGLVSLEITDRRLQSVAVKPVRPFEIWAGKWLGLLGINAALICVATIGMLLSVSATARRYTQEPLEYAALQDQMLTGRRAISPKQPETLRRDAEALMWTRKSEGAAGETESLDRFIQEVKARSAMIAPGGSQSWNLTLPPPRDRHPKQSLQFQFRCLPTERMPISGTWTLRSAGCDPVEIAVTNILDGIHHLAVPDAFSPTARALSITFAHEKRVDTTPHLFFDADAPVTLLLHESNFAMNLVRSMLAMLCFLAAVSAIGLTMGTLFSFPVAVFAGTAIIFVLSLAAGFSENAMGHGHEVAASANAVTSVAEPALLALKHATTGIIGNIPIAALSNGMLFSWRQVADCMVLLLLLLPAILGTVSALLLSQKELAA